MERLFNLARKILTIISSTILAVLTIIIITSIFSRFIGISLYWYDEVSSILLAWLTFYGAALCALNRNHMGFGNLIVSMPYNIKKYIFFLNEIIVISFFITLAWAGFYVLSIFGDETLTSLSFITQAMAQSALPIGCVLFIIAEIISMPKAFKSILENKTQDDEEIEQALRNVNNSVDIKMAKEKLS
ncbi:TRAP transporter small permease protein [Rodentibacter trehalosifermentans]|uniref:TRAP transporter small permease protein n=1 Tax=Rodentibacter trehalosifermentans TaxID=1908263 RepID=A0A1V3IN04_9PAST|nr:TRAP transporter small permease [Rodentibacter trehalosifermentans]OOF43593.1 TRAP transporter small permease protein [Rodentibacter trehalosifermentans]